MSDNEQQEEYQYTPSDEDKIDVLTRKYTRDAPPDQTPHTAILYFYNLVSIAPFVMYIVNAAYTIRYLQLIKGHRNATKYYQKRVLLLGILLCVSLGLYSFISMAEPLPKHLQTWIDSKQWLNDLGLRWRWSIPHLLMLFWQIIFTKLLSIFPLSKGMIIISILNNICGAILMGVSAYLYVKWKEQDTSQNDDADLEI